MNEFLFQNKIAKSSGAKGITLFLILILLFFPIISIVNYLYADQSTLVMLEDFDENEERKGKEERQVKEKPEEVEDVILMADLLAQTHTKTQFFVNKELNQSLQTHWQEVLTPPPKS